MPGTDDEHDLGEMSEFGDEAQASEQEEGDEDEDEDFEDEASHFIEALQNAGLRFPALQSLMDPGIATLIQSLQSPETAIVLDGLQQLSSMLLMPREAALMLFPTRQISQELIRLMTAEEQNPEVLVMTARAAAQLLDSGVPGAMDSLVRDGIVGGLKHLFESSIGYIDVTEQAVVVLRRVAAEHPANVLEGGCLPPILGTIDFFNIHIQRTILDAVSNCCGAITDSNWAATKPLVPLLEQHLTTTPEELADMAAGALSQIIVAVARRGGQNEAASIVGENTWRALVARIMPGTPFLGRILRALSLLAGIQERAAALISECHIASVVQRALTGGEGDAFKTLLHCPKDTLVGSLKLFVALMPVPGSHFQFSGPFRRRESREFIPPSGFDAYATTVVDTVSQIYNASADTHVRELTLFVLLQITWYSPIDILVQFPEQVGQFATSVISHADSKLLVVGGLDIAYNLISRASSRFVEVFENIGLPAELSELQSSSVEPHGTFQSHDDLEPVSAFMVYQIMAYFNLKSKDYPRLHGYVEALRSGEIEGLSNLDSILHECSTPELLRLGIFDVIADIGCQNASTPSVFMEHIRPALPRLIATLQDALSRSERFEALSSSHSGSVPSLRNALTRFVKVRLQSRRNAEVGWAVSVQAIAALEVLEEFCRSRLSLRTRFLPVVGEDDPESEEEENGGRFGSQEHFRFFFNNQPLPHDMSVLGAVYPQFSRDMNEAVIPRSIWSETFTLQFERGRPEQRVPATEAEEVDVWHSVPHSFGANQHLAVTIRLLRVIATLNDAYPILSPHEFLNSKLTTKLNRQLEDPLIVVGAILPQWTFDTVHLYPFLYPFETRLQFVRSTSFGYSRSISRWSTESSEVGRPVTQKYRIGRDGLLQGGLKLLEMSSASPAIVDIEFYGEVGTGLGPTQEFYADISREFALQKDMWRDGDGLFPRAYAQDDPRLENVCVKFKGLGRLIARALLDQRLLDFRFNLGFFSVLLGLPSANILDLVDPMLLKFLNELPNQTNIASLGLDFTLPGTNLEMLPAGADQDLTPNRVFEYIYLVKDWTLERGIRHQLDAFVSGFSASVSIDALHAFSPHELVMLFGGGGNDADWSIQTLQAVIKADHGYTVDSEPVRTLVRVMSALSREERRQFLQFMTGSPNLPLGGFKALQPQFTVVFKHPENDAQPDLTLPSVMTCANYLKLPAYSSEDVLRRQLRTAISEGSGSFPLS